MRIRRAVDGDRPAIARIHSASWQDSYRGIIPDDRLETEVPERIAEHWRDVAIGPEDAVLVAEDEDGALLGFAATWDGESVYVDTLHVVAAARSQGIGRQLLAETARHFLARGRRRAHLDVVAANHRARAFYLALGGRPDGIEDKDLYGTLVPNELIRWDDLAALLARASAPI